MLHDFDGDSRGAAERYAALLRERPGSLELLAQLARVDDASRAPADIQEARRLPEAAGNPEFDRLEALHLGGAGKTAAAIVIVQRGEQKARASKASWMLGRLLVLEAGLRLNNSEAETGIKVLHKARELCLSLGDDICVAQTYRIEGNRLIFEKRYGEALSLYRRGLGLTRQWQNWFETQFLLEGMDAGLNGLHPALKQASLRNESFELLPKSRH
jgi:hypothetical protein